MKSDNAEIWRPVAEWEDYEVSNCGRVRRNGRLLKSFLIGGYPAFNVVGPGGARRSLRVHREVMRAFRPEGEGLVRHLDGNPTNNHLSNLAWGTHLENEADKKLHGTAMLGERHHQAKLNREQVATIRASRARGVDLAAKYGVTPTLISRIRKGKIWTSV